MTDSIRRRSVLAGVATAGMVSTAGCIDTVPFLGDGPVEFGADPVSVPQHLLEETGYREDEVDEITIEETFEVADQRQEVIVTNWRAAYEKGIDLADLGLPVEEQIEAAVFTALSTPQVSVLGRSFNPVAEMSSEELADMVQDRYENVEGLEQVDERSASILGESTTVGKFEADAALSVAGETVELTLHIAEAVEAGDDLVVGVGGYPSVAASMEADNVFTLMEGIVHED